MFSFLESKQLPDNWRTAPIDINAVCDVDLSCNGRFQSFVKISVVFCTTKVSTICKDA